MSKRKAMFDQINLVVRDIRTSADFYRRLGIEISTGSDDPPFHASGPLTNDIGFDLDTDRFAMVWNKGWQGRADLAGRAVLGFRVESRTDVDDLYTELTAAGYRGLQPPWDAFWGARYAIVEDPDGAAVGLMSPADPGKRYWPPEGWDG